MTDNEAAELEGPTCDHRAHDEPVAAVAQYEVARPPAGPTYRVWTCLEHAFEDHPPIRRVDPGHGNRAVADQEGR